MNWKSQKVSTAAIEDRRFCSFFGAQMEIALMVWDMLGECSLHPDKSHPKHKLWTLYSFEGVSKGGPQMLHFWWVEGCHQP
jgi:hypothetical protein